MGNKPNGAEARSILRCAERLSVRRRRPRDPRYCAIRVDTHFFDDSIGPSERTSADLLLDLAENGVLSIAVPHSVRSELEHPNTPPEALRRSVRLPFTYDTGIGSAANREAVRRIMQGNAGPGRHVKDANHLYDAAAWSAGYFVTCDGRIHRKANEIAEALPELWIVRPSELVAIYDDHIRRDVEHQNNHHRG